MSGEILRKELEQFLKNNSDCPEKKLANGVNDKRPTKIDDELVEYLMGIVTANTSADIENSEVDMIYGHY